jgi:hypothetical protein
MKVGFGAQPSAVRVEPIVSSEAAVRSGIDPPRVVQGAASLIAPSGQPGASRCIAAVRGIVHRERLPLLRSEPGRVAGVHVQAGPGFRPNALLRRGIRDYRCPALKH